LILVNALHNLTCGSDLHRKTQASSLALDQLARTLHRAMQREPKRLLNALTSHNFLMHHLGDCRMVNVVGLRSW
jgi:hypothetical protein